jgi:RecB family endonuclease NucS
VNILSNPQIQESLKFIKEYHQKNPKKTYLEIIGDCQVYYHGRARSFLDWGERIIMIKKDGTLLVHQPQMREPINWQSAGSITQFMIKNDKLIVYTRHAKPPEKMRVIFKSIFLLFCASLKDEAKIRITGMERDVVNHIISNPSCVEEGLRITQCEKQVKSGMIDLFGFDKNQIPVVIEVKRSLATISSVHQLRMYVNDIRKGVIDMKVRGILCAPHIPDMVRHLLLDYKLEWMEVDHEIVLQDDYQKTLKEFMN